MFLKAFLPLALDLFETTLPRLLRMSKLLVKPDAVFSLPPLRTIAFAKRPWAILLTLLDFIAFIEDAFMAALNAIVDDDRESVHRNGIWDAERS